MPAKNCAVCGVEYVPALHQGIVLSVPRRYGGSESNESKRRSREQKRIACMNCPQKMTD